MRKLIPILLMTSMIVCGCASTEQSVAVDNYSSKVVTEFNLRTISGGFNVRYGSLMPNIHSSIGQAAYRSKMRIEPNDTCIATWIDVSGQKHEIKIDLSKQSGLGHRPNLLFTIKQDETIAVTPLKE